MLHVYVQAGYRASSCPAAPPLLHTARPHPQVGKPKRQEAVVSVPEELEARLQQLVEGQLKDAYRWEGWSA